MANHVFLNETEINHNQFKIAFFSKLFIIEQQINSRISIELIDLFLLVLFLELGHDIKHINSLYHFYDRNKKEIIITQNDLKDYIDYKNTLLNQKIDPETIKLKLSELDEQQCAFLSQEINDKRGTFYVLRDKLAFIEKHINLFFFEQFTCNLDELYSILMNSKLMKYQISQDDFINELQSDFELMYSLEKSNITL